MLKKWQQNGEKVTKGSDLNETLRNDGCEARL